MARVDLWLHIEALHERILASTHSLFWQRAASAGFETWYQLLLTKIDFLLDGEAPRFLATTADGRGTGAILIVTDAAIIDAAVSPSQRGSDGSHVVRYPRVGLRSLALDDIEPIAAQTTEDWPRSLVVTLTYEGHSHRLPADTESRPEVYTELKALLPSLRAELDERRTRQESVDRTQPRIVPASATPAKRTTPSRRPTPRSTTDH